MERDDLQHLSKEQLIELVLRLQRPEKNSRTSSKPPSTDKKEKRENSRPGGAKPGHEPHIRRLADDPDEFRDHKPGVCDQCGGALSSDAAMELIGEYAEIEIPPVKPYVIRHRRFACRCAHCGVEAKATAPKVATSTPSGPRIHAQAIFLKGFQALSYERLRGLAIAHTLTPNLAGRGENFSRLFGSNILSRTRSPKDFLRHCEL